MLQYDVVIPCHAKDADILPLSVRSIRAHALGARRVVVLSSRALLETEAARLLFDSIDGAPALAEWAWEGADGWPFAKADFRWGWLYQQALKLYAPIVIPDLLPRVLLHDSDVLWRRDVRFVEGGDGALARPAAADGAASTPALAHTPHSAVALYALSDKAVDVEQFSYAEWLPQLLPGLARIDAMRSAIVHHMLVQRDVLEAMLAAVESAHGAAAWRVWDRFDRPSEYEALLAYAALRFPDRIRFRPLRFADTGDVELEDASPDAPYDFVACHSHLRVRLRNERALSVLSLVGSGGW